MFKNTVYFLSMLCALIINCSVMAAAPKTYPPYPDVWGYDLSTFPSVKWGASSIQAYAADDGDIWFLATYSYKSNYFKDLSENNTDYRYMLIKFFKGEKIELKEKELTKFFKLVEGKRISAQFMDGHNITFSDGSKLEGCSQPSSPKRLSPDFYHNYFLKTDKSGKENRYSILAASPQVEIWLDGGLGDVPGAEFFYQKLYVLRNVIALKDDTFITFSRDSNLIIRFNKNLETQFKPVTPVQIQGDYIMRNFFVIDYSVIENLKKEYPGNSIPFYQNIHDSLLSYFHEKYNK